MRRSKPNYTASNIGIISSSILLTAFLITRTVYAIDFERDVSGHLKLAADSSSLSLAEKEISTALDAIDSRRICDGPGYTSVLYTTPDEDVGFWCSNLHEAYDELHQVDDADNLTESNRLMKVRETLLDHTSSGDSVTDPAGISIYPYNVAFAWWGWISLLSFSVFSTHRFVSFVKYDDEY